MNILIFDTTKKEAIVSVVVKQVPYTVKLGADLKHSTTLLPATEKLLQSAHVNLSDIDVFACVTGPGSFTGIRIGMATVLALKEAMQKPQIGSTVFDILAGAVGNGTLLTICTANSFYYANIEKDAVVSVGVIEKKAVEKMVHGQKIYCLQSEREAVAQAYNNLETINNYGQYLINHFVSLAQRKQFTSDAAFVPFYIQTSQAERNALNKADAS